MRLWSVHPKNLDARGLFALCREALLAQAVLRCQTTGYLHHPQLDRFRAQAAPCGAIAEYLRGLHAEAASTASSARLTARTASFPCGVMAQPPR